jgi:peptidoglycan/LPS O-acetylase OafA/YrhL
LIRVIGYMRYRADIDGLRALAVVPVILFHAGVPYFGGGFVGVDVFFTISGYLITSLIGRELSQGNFSTLAFYQRRCRRILPALYALMIFCAVVGYLVYTPNDLRHLAQGIVATTLFLSNVLFWWQSGYFGAELDQLPLLHTWSLSIEEQFYATFPIYLLLLNRYLPSRRCGVTLALAASSFILSAVLVHLFPAATFFLPFTRAWELLIGALLAIAPIPKLDGATHRPVFAVAGVAMVATAVLFYSDRTTFPGTTALLPALGTALLIWAGQDTTDPVTKLLSRRWMVFLGKRSYSLYLWHLPLLAFSSYLSVNELSWLQTTLILALSFVTSLVSWRFIEQPFRTSRSRPAASRPFFASVVAAICVFCAVGLYIANSGGLLERMSAESMQILAEENDFDEDRLYCAFRGPPVPQGISCRLGRRSTEPPQFVLWGDSHAEAWRPALDDIASRYDKSGVFMGRVACAPIIDIERIDEPDCVKQNTHIIDYIVSSQSIRTVILSARWALWAEGSRYKRENRKPSVVHLATLDGNSPSQTENRTALAFGMHETLNALRAAGKDVWLIGPVPEVGYPVPKSLYVQKLGVNPNLEIRPTREELQRRQNFVISLFGRLENEFHVHVIWPDMRLCDQQFCQIEENGTPLYIDDNHLSVHGARSLEALFTQIFD